MTFPEWRTYVHQYRGTLRYIAIVTTLALILQAWELMR